MNRSIDTTSPRRRWAAGFGAALVIGGLGLAVAACGDEEGSGDIATLGMTNAVDEEVTALTLLDDFHVRVNVDSTVEQSATLTIDDNLVDDTDIWLDDDGELFVGWTDLVEIEPSEPPVLTLNVQSFEEVENRSDGTIEITGVAAADLDVELEGDGPVVVDGVEVDDSGDDA